MYQAVVILCVVGVPALLTVLAIRWGNRYIDRKLSIPGHKAKPGEPLIRQDAWNDLHADPAAKV